MAEAAARAATGRLWRMAAGAIAIAVVGTTSFSLLLWLADGMRPLPVTYGRSGLGVLGLILAPICYAAVGWILATRVTANPIGWLFLAAAAAVGSMLPVNLAVAGALEALRPADHAVVAAAWARTVFSVPVMLSVLTVAAIIFPNGRPLHGRWHFAIWTTVLGGGLLALATALDPRGLATYPAIHNPTGLPYTAMAVVTGLRIAAVVVVVGSLAVAVASVWVRYRRGDAVNRAQLRWIMLGVGIAAALVVPYLAIRYVTIVGNELGELLAAAAQLGSCAFPVTAAFAISRYRLYEVDMLIGRTLVYLPLSAALGGLYTAGIALFQRIFVAITGETSDVAVVIAILMVATVFTPMRKWLESIVDRRFPAHKPAEVAVPAEAAPPTRRRRLRGAGTAVAPEPALRAPATRASGSTAPTTLSAPVSAPSPASATAPVAGTPAAGIPMVRLVPVDPSGTVACPLGMERNLAYCMTCEYFLAVARQPQLTVVCQPPVPG